MPTKKNPEIVFRVDLDLPCGHRVGMTIRQDFDAAIHPRNVRACADSFAMNAQHWAGQAIEWHRCDLVSAENPNGLVPRT